MTVKSLAIRRWKIMALVSIHGDNVAEWWCVGRRLTRAGAARTASRRAREGVPAVMPLLPIETLGWGFCHQDEALPRIVGFGPNSRPVSAVKER